MRATCLLALAALTGACAHQARLYNLDTADVLIASFKDTGTGQGPAWIGADRKAATCQGEYSTMAGGSSTWGAIYYSGQVATGVSSSVPDSQQGQAVMHCQDGRVIECEYVTSSMSAQGHGACRDNKGQRYRLMF